MSDLKRDTAYTFVHVHQFKTRQKFKSGKTRYQLSNGKKLQVPDRSTFEISKKYDTLSAFDALLIYLVDPGLDHHLETKKSPGLGFD